MSIREAQARKTTLLKTPTGLTPDAIRDISGALNILLADVFGLYLKTKNFHWHLSGPHFRDYHLLLDEHGDQIFAMTDAIAERVRKVGGTTLRSIGHIGRLQRILDNDGDFVTSMDMLSELRDDNRQITAAMRETHSLCDEYGDVATASLLENWIDEAGRRTWFLFEATRQGGG
ncbi:DNA starvation/stationary phase protection protein [Bradyrhizobium canariense]|uniref:DNA starvation/stationary phase protection protein n=1 Tax=Bradyrhizobium canariense TaxID=255045 RepID=A0ABX3WT19_9BRAD|nr:DNA starvation/stationary phase protection protein [Bradyrhizobium canariense]OSJ07845.1 DNA starvation/stationary phase protection protein [Bradyrhizobium canariense]OSJ20690.1 DNA starvation/stationary phase protection protein [Bradyrhizobium canariense]